MKEDLHLDKYYILDTIPIRETGTLGFPDKWVGLLQETDARQSELIAIPPEQTDQGFSEAKIKFLATIPLWREDVAVGLMVLGYQDQPQSSYSQRRLWTAAGKSLANLLDLEGLRKEDESYSVQAGLLSLITRYISQASDVGKILSLTLDHTVPMLNAYWGSIWMYSDDGEKLEMASSLSHSPIPSKPRHLRKDQGLIGWVGTQGESLLTDQPAKHPGFDPQVDPVKASDEFIFLAVPLRNQNDIMGVLSLHHEPGVKISDHDVVIVESIADLTASFISNINMLQELRDFSRQQNALFEMSQQIAQGLNLQTALNRALQWVNRLIEVEVGLLWLVDEGVTALEPVASLGLDIKSQEQNTIALDQGLFGQVVTQGKAAVINDPDKDPLVDDSIREILGEYLKDFVLLPMIYRGESIGVLGLVNKVGGRFQSSEMALLTTASDMMAIAVGNARLHSHTIDLLQEREHVHALALQTARFATVGRLTASLSHEINNPMQAIRGALELAMENLDDRETLVEYITMCLRESERVVHLINRMRHIYRQTSKDPEPILINETINEISIVARKEIARHGVSLQLDLAPGLGDVVGMVDQLRLVFLSVALSLSDALSQSEGEKHLTIRTSPIDNGVLIEYQSVPQIPSWAVGLDKRDGQSPTEASVSLLLSKDIIVALGGSIQFLEKDHGNAVAIELPILEQN
jgi:GAF domain-containing protein